MTAGEQIKALREERGLRAADIERLSRRLAQSTNNPDYVIPHPTLNGIEGGSVPTIYKLAALADALSLPIQALLELYGIEVSGSNKSQGLDREIGTHFEIRNQADVPVIAPTAAPVFSETQLVQDDSPVWSLIPSGVRARLGNGGRFAYAVIGGKEDVLWDVLPGGSFVEIDREQNWIFRFQWKSLAERPIYCLWHGEGHICCWCEQQGNVVTTVPHPLSRQSCKRFRTPRDVTVIGRVVNSWQLLRFEN